jgi:hypothetical protein
LQAAYQEIDRLEPTQKDSLLLHTRTALYPWLLSVALMLLLYLVLAKPLQLHFTQYKLKYFFTKRIKQA